MSKIDASCYVIDCGGNLTPKLAFERNDAFIKYLRQKAPPIPILLVENLFFTHGRFNKSIWPSIDSINVAFKKAFVALKKEDMKDLYSLPAEKINW